MPRSVRRVVTGHDARGRAVVLHDGGAPNAKVRQATGLTSILVWVTDECPAGASGTADRADPATGVAPPARGAAALPGSAFACCTRRLQLLSAPGPVSTRGTTASSGATAPSTTAPRPFAASRPLSGPALGLANGPLT